MIKQSSRGGHPHTQQVYSAPSQPGEQAGPGKEPTNQRDSAGKINTEAHEDTEGWRGREGEGGQRHGLLQRLEAEDEGSGGRVGQRRARGAEEGEGSSSSREGTEDSGGVEVVVVVGRGGTAVRGMCSLNQVSPGAETERNTSSSRGGRGGVLKQTGSSVSTSSTSYLLGRSGGDATGCSPGLQVQGLRV